MNQSPVKGDIGQSMLAEIEEDEIDAEVGMTDSDMGLSELEEGHYQRDLV